jgi:hypothetical protein
MGLKKENKTTSDSQIKAVQKYDTKTYDRITVRVPKGYREQLKELVKPDSVNGFITKAIEKALNGSGNSGIDELEAYARSAGITPEEYIKAAVVEKMQRQDADFKEPIERIKNI